MEVDNAYLGGVRPGGKCGRDQKTKRHLSPRSKLLKKDGKTALGGTYHAFDFKKYGFLYLAEPQYRFNRRFDMPAIRTRLIHAAAATGSRTEAWMRLAEDER